MKAKLLTISLMVGLFMGCHDFLDVKPVGKLIPTEVEEFENILNNTYTVDWYYMDNNKGTLLASLGDNLQISENSANYNYTQPIRTLTATLPIRLNCLTVILKNPIIFGNGVLIVPSVC